MKILVLGSKNISCLDSNRGEKVRMSQVLIAYFFNFWASALAATSPASGQPSPGARWRMYI